MAQNRSSTLFQILTVASESFSWNSTRIGQQRLTGTRINADMIFAILRLAAAAAAAAATAAAGGGGGGSSKNRVLDGVRSLRKTSRL
jgi:hypothetical protein